MGALGCVAGVVVGRDGVADDDLVRAEKDVLDEESQDALAFGDGRGSGLAAQAGEEVLEVVGELEIDSSVRELRVEGIDLSAQAGLAGA